jgi:hypothetical protein
MNGDLVILAADKDIEYALRGLCTRHQSLGIRPLQGLQLLTHPQHDPGVFKTGPEVIRSYAPTCGHALLVLDWAWEGAPSKASIEQDIDTRLRPVWGSRARTICIDPEVEVWVWSDSPHVATELGWGNLQSLRAYLEAEGLWKAPAQKPSDPKAAFRAALHEKRRPPSASIFQNLGQRVGLARCHDPAFGQLRAHLQSWFPLESETTAPG